MDRKPISRKPTIPSQEQGDVFDQVIKAYSKKGFQIVSRTAGQVQLLKKKEFSFIAAILWFCVGGVGLIVYLLYYFSKSDELRTFDTNDVLQGKLETPWWKENAIALSLAVAFVILMIMAVHDDSSPSAAASPQAKITQATTPVSSGPWSYSEETDKMRGSTTYFASVDSTNALDFDFPYNGGAIGTITLRNSKKYGYDVILKVSKGQFSCGVNSCETSVKFDNGPVQTYQWNQAADGSTDTVFSFDYKGFVAHLKKAKHVTIEATFYNEGTRLLEFDVSNLKWKW